MLEVLRASINQEEQMEDEEVDEGQQPLKHVATHPRVSLVGAVVPVRPAAEATCHEPAEDRVQDGRAVVPVGPRSNLSRPPSAVMALTPV